MKPTKGLHLCCIESLGSVLNMSCMHYRLGGDSEEPKWYRFNDTMVDEFMMHDEALAAECFGGSYKSRSGEGSK